MCSFYLFISLSDIVKDTSFDLKTGFWVDFSLTFRPFLTMHWSKNKHNLFIQSSEEQTTINGIGFPVFVQPHQLQ